MAVKTANKRAYLRGEGEERAKYGLSLVVVNSRQGGCPDCARYIGRVFIDDVYSNGKKSDGDYPLLSTAIAEGLFHPRCKDSTSTYYPELDDLDEPLSDDEIAELDRQRGLEEQQQYAEKQANSLTAGQNTALTRITRSLLKQEQTSGTIGRIGLKNKTKILFIKYLILKSKSF